MDKFINRDRTTDITIDIDVILNYIPEAKEILDKTNTNKDVKNVETLHIQDVNANKSNQVSMEKVSPNLQNKGYQDDSSNCISETNEEINNKENEFNTEDLETLTLGQTKRSDYNTPQKNGAKTNIIYDMNHSVSPHTVSYISRNANDSTSAA